MRRALVLSDETARHPFLQTLPRHVRHGALPQRAFRITAQDLREFLMAYCACVLGVMAFIA